MKKEVLVSIVVVVSIIAFTFSGQRRTTAYISKQDSSKWAELNKLESGPDTSDLVVIELAHESDLELEIESETIENKDLFEKAMQFRRDLGYVSVSAYESYQAYDDESLLTLIQQGDKLAALQYVDNADLISEKCSRAEVAIIAGITAMPLYHLYMCSRDAAEALGPEGNNARKEAMLKMFALLEYGALLGDFRVVGHASEQSQNLTEEDFKKISAMANGLLDLINRRRANYGLTALQEVSPERSPMRDIYLGSKGNAESFSVWERRLLNTQSNVL